MKAVLCRAYGPPESLVIGEVPAPRPGADQVRIAVHAAGLNFPDTLIITGKYQFKPAFPFIPGMEIAGEVLEVGTGVNGFKPGDRVLASTGTGAFAEEALASATAVYPLPAAMDFAAGAAFPVTYGTSYHALVDRGRLQAGDWLLVHGAGGGVGLTAVELGKLLGARVIATAGSDAKLAVAKAYGADHVINYTREKIRDRVKEITGGHGADVIYDPVGGDVFDESIRCIAWEGRLLVVGFAAGRIPVLPANLALLKGCQVVGVFCGAFAARTPERHRRNLETMLTWCGESKLKPYVSARFPLEQVAAAMNALIERKVAGKAVLLPRGA